MSQAEIRNYLKQNSPATAKEIAAAIGVSYDSTLKSLNRMEKFEEVEKEKTKLDNGHTASAFSLKENPQKVHVI